jgi:hypothetical protein
MTFGRVFVQALNRKEYAMSTDAKIDLAITPLKNLDWSKEKRRHSVKEMFDYVTKEAEDAIKWYLQKKFNKRRCARYIRICAITLTSISGIIPLLSQIWRNNGDPVIEPAWASVALTLAATLWGLDRFFGFSSSWIRFIFAETQIRNMLQEFKLEWEIKRSESKGQELSDSQVKEMLSMCQSFLKSINDVLTDDVKQWKENFTSAAKMIEDSIQTTNK